MTLAYLGPAGTFTEQAARALAADGAALTPCGTIGGVFEMVESGAAAQGVVPIENAIEGAVNATIDALIFDANLSIERQLLSIERQLSLPVVHNLMVQSGANIQNIEAILSHPQALAQCRRFIESRYPNAAQEATASTAEAARRVSLSPSGSMCAAIAAKPAAALYGLEVAAESIQDTNDNATRFVLLTREAATPPRPGCTTSVAFSTANRPGGLYQILDIFAIWDVNLTKILSRPFKGRQGEYVFYVDIECDENAPDVTDALRMVERKATMFKVLGTYECQ